MSGLDNEKCRTGLGLRAGMIAADGGSIASLSCMELTGCQRSRSTCWLTAKHDDRDVDAQQDAQRSAAVSLR